MKILKIITPIVLLALLLVVWLAPIGPMPGLFIGGTETQVPDVWGDTSNIHEIKLEVPGSLNRVVIIWVIQVAGDLHVVGARDSGWVSMLEQGGNVRMRMGDKTYSLNAALLTTSWEPVLEAYIDKYRADYPDIISGFPEIEDAIDTISVYRLTGR